jgi:hypothetical protein
MSSFFVLSATLTHKLGLTVMMQGPPLAMLSACCSTGPVLEVPTRSRLRVKVASPVWKRQRGEERHFRFQVAQGIDSFSGTETPTVENLSSGNRTRSQRTRTASPCDPHELKTAIETRSPSSWFLRSCTRSKLSAMQLRLSPRGLMDPSSPDMTRVCHPVSWPESEPLPGSCYDQKQPGRSATCSPDWLQWLVPVVCNQEWKVQELRHSRRHSCECSPTWSSRRSGSASPT